MKRYFLVGVFRRRIVFLARSKTYSQNKNWTKPTPMPGYLLKDWHNSTFGAKKAIEEIMAKKKK